MLALGRFLRAKIPPDPSLDSQGSVMDSLRKALSDPSWWFTVIIVGVFVAIVGGLLKDGLKSAIPQLIARYRQSKEARKIADRRYIEFLTAHPSLLQIAVVRTSLESSRLIILLVLLIGLPSFAATLRANPDFRLLSVHLLNDRAAARLIAVSFPVLFFAWAILFWRIQQYQSLLSRAHEEYRHQESEREKTSANSVAPESQIRVP